MANPKRKLSRSKRDKRRSQWYASMKDASLSRCNNCGEMRLPHHACPECGYYKGKSTVIPKSE